MPQRITTAVWPVALALFIALSLPAAAQSRGESATATENIVTANGTARVYREPDYLEIFLSVSTLKATAGDAQADATQRMEAVVKALKGLQLPGEELQTGSVDLAPRYNNQRDDAEPRIVAYNASNNLRVRTSDLKAAARIIDAGLKAGANQINSVEFGLKEYQEAREQALGQAVLAARRKAKAMAGALDLQLGPVLSVSESGGVQPFYPNRMTANFAQAEGAFGGGGEGAFEPGKVEVTASATLVFRLQK